MIVAIVQARMGANRLPGKVLMDINGISLLQYQIQRISRSKLLERYVVATSTASQDDQIDLFCQKHSIECFRGPENDVLSRYYECAKKYNADVIVRLTADCPFSDPEIIDRVIKLFKEEKADYAANTIPPESNHFPDGFDVEVFTMQALERANLGARDDHDREHVTFYFWKYQNGFRTLQLSLPLDYSQYRLTVDYPEDLEVARFIARELKLSNKFGTMEEIVGILNLHPEIKELNSRYYFGIGWKK